MAALTICDNCNMQITDGAELIADYMPQKNGTRNRDTLDYCFECLQNAIVDIIAAPRFTKMFVTKIGIHEDR